MESNSEESKMQLKETSRLEAFSDGIFSIAITLLIIELVQVLHSQHDEKLIKLLLHNWQSFFAFGIGFLTILICWINHHLVFTYIKRVDSRIMWVNALVLFMVAFTPFPTAILAEYFESERHLAMAFFGFNYVGMSVAAYCISAYVYRKMLIDNSDRVLFKKFVSLYKYSIFYTLLAFGVCFISVSIAICMFSILFMVFAFPKEASMMFVKSKGEKKPVKKNDPTHTLNDVNPKLPMRNKAITKDFYLDKLGFIEFGNADYDGYLMVQKDNIQIHFFEFKELDPKENYGQVYIRTDNIDGWYQFAKRQNVDVTALENKPWGQKEFSIHDPDNNLLTCGQSDL